MTKGDRDEGGERRKMRNREWRKNNTRSKWICWPNWQGNKQVKVCSASRQVSFLAVHTLRTTQDESERNTSWAVEEIMIGHVAQTSWRVLVRMRVCQVLFLTRQLSIRFLVSCILDWTVNLCTLDSLGCHMLPSASRSATTIPHKNIFKQDMLAYTELTPWSRDLLEKQTDVQSYKKFPAFDGTWKFITVLTKDLYRSSSSVGWIQSTTVSYFSTIHFNIILPCTDRPSRCSPPGFSTITSTQSYSV